MAKTSKLPPTTEAARPSEEKIRELAYRYYLDRGGEAGHEIEDWLRAEAEVSASRMTSEAA